MKRSDWVLFGILAAVLGVPGCSNQSQQKVTPAASPQPSVTQAPAPPPSVPAADTLEIPSVLSVEHSVDLLAQRDGIVQEVFYDQDSWVKKGAVLARLDDLSDVIRTPEITAADPLCRRQSRGARVPGVRLQRLAAGSDNVVAEGRDQGTVVFPHAECKIFLTAGAEERARRRVADLANRGKKMRLETVLDQQARRDESDQSRSVGPLVRAPDAVEISTDGLSSTAVVDRLEQLVRERMGAAVVEREWQRACGTANR